MLQKFWDCVWTVSHGTVHPEPELLSQLLPLQKMQILWVDPASTNAFKSIAFIDIESLLKLNTEVKRHFLLKPSQRISVHPELQRSGHVQVWVQTGHVLHDGL